MLRFFSRILLLALFGWLPLQAVSAPKFEDSMAQRTLACVACHGKSGRAGPDGYYPRLAGKPAGYLYNQLLDFRDGRRHYGLMTGLVDPLTDAYLREIAQYFSQLDLPYPAPQPAVAPKVMLERGRVLVTQGDATRKPPMPPDAQRISCGSAPLPAMTTPPVTTPASPVPALIAQGAYLARAGDCMACHTARGGAPFAGGRAIVTPFGTVFSSNLTSDTSTSIGSWSSADFWQAIHHGRSKDGRLLNPAFPYTSFTQVTRTDSDALFAYLQTVPPSRQPNTVHSLRWPFGTQAALAVWRALYFTPGIYQADAAQTADWNRGAYLVGGLGHCGACHTPRNALGASKSGVDLTGGLIPMQNWYAPSLRTPLEAGVSNGNPQDVAALLKTGVHPGGSATGPMAEVVLNSTQYLSGSDLSAMTVFLKSLAPTASQGTGPVRHNETLWPVPGNGARLYEAHCVQCHGDRGEGVSGAYPPLAHNRAVILPNTANLVQMVLYGGYAPATAGDQRPFGMPPLSLKWMTKRRPPS